MTLRSSMTGAMAILAGCVLAACTSAPEAGQVVAVPPSSSTETVPPGECPPLYDYDDVNQKLNVGDFISPYCDGQWQVLGQYSQGDGSRSLTRWNGTWWERVSTSDGYPMTNQPCYTEADLHQGGVPDTIQETLKEHLLMCPAKQQSPTNAAPTPISSVNPVSCDGGKYILLVDTVTVGPGKLTDIAILEGILNHIGAQATTPGACSSLPAEQDGQDVYPIFRTFGRDRAGACAAQARGEGTVYELTNNPGASSPC